MKSQSVILLMGGNQGRVEATMQNAIRMIDTSLGKVIKVSSIYSTKAWGPIPQDDFLNQALIIQTVYPPQYVLQAILNIEKYFGRKREIKYGPRTLDIDILFYGNSQIKTSNLVVPHPEIQNRRFALVPLVELHRNFVHPILKQTMQQLLENCKDTLQVNKIK